MEVVNLKFNISLFFLSLFLSLFLIVGFVSAANWYVDRDAPVGGNGQSWSTAWKKFSDIQWTQIQPGDIVYISGGYSQKVYGDEFYQTPPKPRNYTFRISAQGTPDNFIIVTKGADPGHNGDVIFDAGNLSIGAAILFNSAKYVIVENFTIRNYGSGFFFKSGTKRGIDSVIIRNNKIFDSRGTGIFFDGWSQSCNNGSCDYDTINNVLISNNIISSYNYTPSQTDLIYGQMFQNLTIEKNVLIQKNVWDNGICDHSSNSTPHADAIQTFTSKDLTVRYNIIDYRLLRPCSNTFMLSNNIGFIDIYGNIILSYVPGMTNKGRQSIIEKISSNDPVYNGSNYMRIYNNIFISDAYNALGIKNIDGEYEVKNNIFYSLIEGANGLDRSIVFLVNPPNNISNINGNLYWGVGGFNVPQFYWISWGSRPRTWEQVQSLGAELNGVSADPLFVNIYNDNYALLPSSPAIDAGLDLGLDYRLALNGVLRPQGSGWDIGAFEYVSGVQCAPADNDCNGCVSLSEISSFVARWLNGEISLSVVSGAVSLWLNGGC
ncbi:MAG: hypothetical protein KatS3mg002_0143 [Candidatus Woesearchaeota archaeon]|nr:MAG: hypothetical protein KatS3mg002_0143 [Candidatus Woesearchaeota archaeon]